MKCHLAARTPVTSTVSRKGMIRSTPAENMFQPGIEITETKEEEEEEEEEAGGIVGY